MGDFTRRDLDLISRAKLFVDLNKDKEFREAIITASIEFTTPEGLCTMLGERFYEAEHDKYKNPENTAATQIK